MEGSIILYSFLHLAFRFLTYKFYIAIVGGFTLKCLRIYDITKKLKCKYQIKFLILFRMKIIVLFNLLKRFIKVITAINLESVNGSNSENEATIIPFTRSNKVSNIIYLDHHLRINF